jgi:hypothetical protein
MSQSFTLNSSEGTASASSISLEGGDTALTLNTGTTQPSVGGIDAGNESLNLFTGTNNTLTTSQATSWIDDSIRRSSASSGGAFARSPNNNSVTSIPDLADINITSKLSRLTDSTTYFTVVPAGGSPEDVISTKEVEAAITYRNSFKSGAPLTEYVNFFQTIESKYFGGTAALFYNGGQFSNDSILFWVKKYFALPELSKFRNATSSFYRQSWSSANYSQIHLKFILEKYAADTKSFFGSFSDSIGLLGNSKYHQLDSTQPIFDITQQNYGVPIPFTANMENKIGPTARNLMYNLSKLTTASMRRNLMNLAYYNAAYKQNFKVSSRVPHACNLVNDIAFFVDFAQDAEGRMNLVKTKFTSFGGRLWNFIQYISNIGNRCAVNLRDIYAPIDGYDKDFVVTPGTTDIAVNSLDQSSIDRQISEINNFAIADATIARNLYANTADANGDFIGQNFISKNIAFNSNGWSNVYGTGGREEPFSNEAYGPFIGELPQVTSENEEVTKTLRNSKTLEERASILDNDAAFQAKIREMEAKYPGFTKEKLYAIMQGESGFNPTTQTGSYVGLFQVGGQWAASKGLSLSTIRNSSPAQQLEYYDQYLSTFNYTGAAPLPIMQAAPGWSQRLTNAPANTIIYAAGSREALANPGWRDANGAVTNTSLISYYYGRQPTYIASTPVVQDADVPLPPIGGASSNSTIQFRTTPLQLRETDNFIDPTTGKEAPLDPLVDPMAFDLSAEETEFSTYTEPQNRLTEATADALPPTTIEEEKIVLSDKVPQPSVNGTEVTSAQQNAAVSNASSASSRPYSNRQRMFPFSFLIRTEDIDGTSNYIEVDYLLKKIVSDNFNPYTRINTLASGIAASLIQGTQDSGESGQTLEDYARLLARADLKNIFSGNNADLILEQLGISPNQSGATGQLYNQLKSILNQKSLTSSNLSQGYQTFISLVSQRLPTDLMGTIGTNSAIYDQIAGELNAISGGVLPTTGDIFDSLNPFNYIDINIQGIIPSVSLGSFADFINIASEIGTSGPPKSISQAYNIAKEINDIVCNFQLPFIDWPIVEELIKMEFKPSEIGQAIKDEFEKIVDRLGEIFDPAKIYENIKVNVENFFKQVYKDLFTCDEKDKQNKSGQERDSSIIN